MEGVAVQSDETLERFVIEVDAVVTKHVEATLKTIDARLARIETFVTLCEEMAAQLQESPMFGALVANSGAGFGFPS